MSLSRVSGERCEVQRAPFDELAALEKAYIDSVPFRLQHLAVKYFAIFRMRMQWGWKWNHIAQTVGLHRLHCIRVFNRTKADLQALAAGACRQQPRLLDLPEAEDFDD